MSYFCIVLKYHSLTYKPIKHAVTKETLHDNQKIEKQVRNFIADSVRKCNWRLFLHHV